METRINRYSGLCGTCAGSFAQAAAYVAEEWDIPVGHLDYLRQVLARDRKFCEEHCYLDGGFMGWNPPTVEVAA